MTDALTLVGAGQFSSSQIVMLALAVAGLTILMLSTRRKVRQSARSSPPPARERYAHLQKQQKAARDLEQVMLELDQLSRQIHGRIDTKLAKLEIVIRDADQRIEKLAGLLRSARNEPTIEVAVDREDPQEASGRPVNAGDSRHAVVYHLADGGVTPVEIARKVGKTTGEIELILALRKAKVEADRPVGDAVSTHPAPRI